MADAVHPIRELRRNAGLTQAQLAKRARVSERTIHNIENSAVHTRYGIRCRILRTLEIPFEQHRELFEAKDVG
jgi:DNA-binding XRE family transcriptional regulator